MRGLGADAARGMNRWPDSALTSFFFVLIIILLTLDSLSRRVIANGALRQVESVKNTFICLVIAFRGLSISLSAK